MLCTPLLHSFEVDYMEPNEEQQRKQNNDQSLGDCGSISAPPDVLVDYGTLEPDSNKRTCFIAVGGVSDSEDDSKGLKIGGEAKPILNVSKFVAHEDLNVDEIIYCGIILTWIGFGTVFELGNGSERITSPYLASGTVR
jgi:hypothetical protein